MNIQIKFKPESYSPSSEEYRETIQVQRNKNRMDAYREKQAIYTGDEPSDYDKVLSADPGFAEFLDSLDDENRCF